MDRRKGGPRIYILYDPSHHGLVPTMDIVFFHGLQPLSYTNAYRSTWSSKIPHGNNRGTGKVLWPRDWLHESFPRARILSASYDSRAVGGRRTLDDIAGNLVRELVEKARVGQRMGNAAGRRTTTVLVGHSLGGLVIKKICLIAIGRTEEEVAYANLVRSIGGVFFYATPHNGAPVARKLKDRLGGLVRFSPVMELLADYEHGAAFHLSQDFNSACRNHNWGERLLAEGMATTLIPCLWHDTLVPPLPRDRQIRDESYTIIEDANHVTICKPPSTAHETYERLRVFVQGFQEEQAIGTQDPREGADRINAMIRDTDHDVTFNGLLLITRVLDS